MTLSLPIEVRAKSPRVAPRVAQAVTPAAEGH